MNETKKHLFTAATVALCCATLIGGIVWRNKVDVGEAGIFVAKDSEFGELLASTKKSREVSETSFYANLVKLLKENYVESVKDETKLALGSVKEMIGSLGDLNSRYFDAEEFRVYQNAMNGKYEGIGALFVLEIMKGSPSKGALPIPGQKSPVVPQERAKIPVARVAAVAPGGPADKAGVKAGDWVEAVDGRDVFSPKLFKEFMDARAMARREDVPSEKKFEVSDRLQAKAENMIMPVRAMRKLTIGDSGIVKVVFNRAGASYERSIERSKSEVPAWTGAGNAAVLRFQPGVSKSLAAFLKGKQDVTLDLRNSGLGSLNEMAACLALVAPPGSYGSFVSERSKYSERLALKTGNPKPPTLTLLVDATTRGPAEIFAKALTGRPNVTIVGGKTAGALEQTLVVALPQGHGYTLVKGVYKGAAK
ncbi:MAG: S41 family peptidase [Fimbriimonadaceae bacterium]